MLSFCACTRSRIGRPSLHARLPEADEELVLMALLGLVVELARVPALGHRRSSPTLKIFAPTASSTRALRTRKRLTP